MRRFFVFVAWTTLHLGCGGATPPPLSGSGGVSSLGGAGSGGGTTALPPPATGGGGTGAAGGGYGGTGPAEGAPPCADLFAPRLQTFSVDIGAGDWAAIQAEFVNVAALPQDQFVAYQPTYYPIVFHYGAETVTTAFIRLKGDSSWQEAVELDGEDGKMQFVIAFDHVDPNAAFHGVSKIVLDMPPSDPSFLRDRVANSWLRSIGIPGLCATSGTLAINGAPYGVYVAEEHVGHHFLKQFFPGNADGDLFQGGWVPKTNTLAPNWTKLQTFWNAMTPAALTAVVDVPSSLLSWAAEAMLNDGDGYYGGDHNFYLYDEGAKGYVFFPNDLDSSLDYLGTFSGDPVTWWSARSTPQLIGQHYLVVMNDPTLRAAYVTALGQQLARWDVGQLQSWIDAWAAQIRGPVADDPHKPAGSTLADFDAAVALARRGIQARADFVTRWLACKDGDAGQGQDQDQDGFRWCDDCRDDQASIHPGAPEVCGNAIDDNCDGRYDEGCPAP